MSLVRTSSVCPGERDRVHPEGLEAAGLREVREAPRLEAAAGAGRDCLAPDVRKGRRSGCLTRGRIL